jgi:hypothetical protein
MLYLLLFDRIFCGEPGPTSPENALARFQAEWIPVSRPESAPSLKERARSDAKPVFTFAERALRRRRINAISRLIVQKGCRFVDDCAASLTKS